MKYGLLTILAAFILACPANAQVLGGPVVGGGSGGGSLTLTTTGSSGPAALVGSNLNVPVYSGASGTALSALLSSTTTNIFDNANFAQSWTWNSLGANTALTLGGTTTGAGKVLSVTLTGATNTGYAGYFSNTSTTGYAGYFNGAVGVTGFFQSPIFINPIGVAATYTVLSSDIGYVLTHTRSTAVAVTLPQAGTTGFELGKSYTEVNYGVGAVTITPTTSTINGATSITLNQNQSADIISDGSNWIAAQGSANSLSGTVANLVVTGAGVPTFSPLVMTGTFDTTGTTTTNLPMLFIQPTGTTAVTNWSSNGTAIGVNAPSGFVGTMINVHVNGGATALFTVDYQGNMVNAGSQTIAGSISSTGGNVFSDGILGWDSATPSHMRSPANGTIELVNSADTNFTRLDLGGTTSSFPALAVTGTGAAASLGVTLADASANAPFLASTIKTNGYTVGALPSGTTGMRAYVTDQTTSCPLAGGSLTGSGGVTCPVFYNGSAWVGD